MAAPAIPRKTWWPTRKWWAALVTASGGLAVTAISMGVWTREMTAAAVTVLTQLIVAYITPNQDTPGGVPTEGGPRM